jgi:hypothetical protein
MGEWTDGEKASELPHREAGSFGEAENPVDVIHQLLVAVVDDDAGHGRFNGQ